MHQRVRSRELNCQGMKLVFQMYDACLLCYQRRRASVEKRAHAHTHTHTHADIHTHTHTHTHTLTRTLCTRNLEKKQN